MTHNVFPNKKPFVKLDRI